jgi:hypothetical protein
MKYFEYDSGRLTIQFKSSNLVAVGLQTKLRVWKKDCDGNNVPIHLTILIPVGIAIIIVPVVK